MTQDTVAKQAPAFPASRAFVVQFAAPTEEVPAPWLGRVEHLVSGRSARFFSWTELQAFVEQILAQGTQQSP